MAYILIVDDEASVCWALRKAVEEMGLRADAVASAEEALDRVAAEPPGLVLLDVRLPGMDGLEALRRIRESAPSAEVVVMTAHGTMETAVEALCRGAYEYLPKPMDLKRAQAVIRRALERGQLSQEVQRLRSEVAGLYGLESLVGKTPAMQDVFRVVAAVCTTDATVLLTGESGTGKELVARALHANSPRRDGPLEPVHAGAIPEGLVESELFGHVKGAFTGAVESRTGRFLRAHGGTLFLDEVGDVPPAVQVRLLRFLESRKLQRVGADEWEDADVRIVAATNRNLDAAVADGSFREDLYFRLNVVPIRLPPLRERMDDLPLLVAHFLHQLGGEGVAIREDAMAVLRRHVWPGNVRELRNALEHAVALSRDREIGPEHLPARLHGEARGLREDALDALARAATGGAADEGRLHGEFLARCEKPLIEAALERTGGSQVKAARMLGITRTTLRKRMEAYGLRGE